LPSLLSSFFSSSTPHPHLHSFPTRRSSDLNATYYRHFHAWHHRYTQDPERDPELIFPKAKNRREYLTELSGLTFWWRRILDYPRSEEHTSELQSLRHLVCRLLLEKKKNKKE